MSLPTFPSTFTPPGRHKRLQLNESVWTGGISSFCFAVKHHHNCSVCVCVCVCVCVNGCFFILVFFNWVTLLKVTSCWEHKTFLAWLFLCLNYHFFLPFLLTLNVSSLLCARLCGIHIQRKHMDTVTASHQVKCFIACVYQRSDF